MSADEIYQAVTDRMVLALERGVVPWRTPWTLAGRPRSMSTGNAYRGVNTWLLALAARERGWGSPWFGTYRQIQERGGQVRRGEKSTLVTFWKTLEKQEPDAVTGEVMTRAVPMLRKFRVFSACQADGLPDRFFPEPGEERPIAGPQAVLDGYAGQAGRGCGMTCRGRRITARRRMRSMCRRWRGTGARSTTTRRRSTRQRTAPGIRRG